MTEMDGGKEEEDIKHIRDQLYQLIVRYEMG